jgi:hypothetical protein
MFKNYMDEQELRSGSFVLAHCVIHCAKAYWKFLFWHKLCNVLTIWNIHSHCLQDTIDQPSFFFLLTLNLCGPFVCTAKQNKYLLILKIKNKFACV